MFKKTLNRVVVGLKLTTVSPLLIRAGDTGLDPARAELSCVRSRHARFGSTVYIPGSSAKGVIRSAAEALIRGMSVPGVGEAACDPLDHRNSCGGQWGKGDRKSAATHDVHRGHCLACRLFGSTAMRGRCAIRDLFPFEAGATEAGDNLAAANRTETRSGVSIDRIAGSVRHGPFESEMVPVGVWFDGDIALSNVQAWQLGLLAAALREVDEGFAQLGSTKSRGLGVMSVTVERVLFEQVARDAKRPLGVGAIVDADESRRYGLLNAVDLPEMGAGSSRGLTRRFVAEGAAAKAWLMDAEDALGALS